jgi:alpha-tubulin suppressor-like RCC1 family protein
MTTKISGSQITNFTIETTQLSNTAVAAFAQSLAPKVLYANVANSAFTVLDDTAVNVGGGFIVVTGSDFVSGATVLVDTTLASSVTFVNSTTLRVQIPSKAAASYNLYVVNPDGGVGIKVNGVTYSSDPTWVTSSPLANQAANTAFNVTLSATGATSYTVAAGSTLPAGTQLLANGYFYGTVTIGVETTYSFNIVATDAELQDSSKTFQVTVTVTPPSALYVLGGFSTLTGLNDGVTRSSPTQIGGNNVWSKIAFGGANALAIKTDGTLWAWGGNSTGSMGLNISTTKSSPTQVGTSADWANVFTGSNAQPNAAVKTNGTFWIIGGENGNGQLGLNDRVHRSSPVQLGSGTNWSAGEFKIATGDQGGMHAIKTDGTLWSWGENIQGSLGTNNTVYRSSPVQVGTDTSWSTIAAGTRGVVAVKTNGTLWTWGNAANGQLGTNNTTPIKSSPTQVGSETTWLQATGTFYARYAIKTDGTLWAWGKNDYGQLGLNDRVYKSSPTQVGSGTDWNKVYSMDANAMATKTNGTLWAWGSSFNGQLGLNDRVSRSSPVQVGTSATWSSVTQGSSAAFAILN